MSIEAPIYRKTVVTIATDQDHPFEVMLRPVLHAEALCGQLGEIARIGGGEVGGTEPDAALANTATAKDGSPRGTFRFSLGERVGLNDSNEIGRIIGRAEYSNQINSYLVRYRAGDGRQTEAWWTEDAILGV